MFLSTFYDFVIFLILAHSSRNLQNCLRCDLNLGDGFRLGINILFYLYEDLISWHVGYKILKHNDFSLKFIEDTKCNTYKRANHLLN